MFSCHRDAAAQRLQDAGACHIPSRKSGACRHSHRDAAASTATPDPLPKLDPAVKAALSLCENVLPGQVCLVKGPVRVTAQPESFLMPFREPGQVLNLADIQTLKLGEAGSTKGIVLMRI